MKALWALVGGLAVSARTVPRFTRDLDFAVRRVRLRRADDERAAPARRDLAVGLALVAS